jgi:hypothetical protein
MHPALIETLARQRIVAMRAAPVSRHRVTGQASTQPLQPLRQRFGWVLVQVGLRLAVRQART